MQVVISPYLMAAVPYKRANRYKYQLKREAQKKRQATSLAGAHAAGQKNETSGCSTRSADLTASLAMQTRERPPVPTDRPVHLRAAPFWPPSVNQLRRVRRSSACRCSSQKFNHRHHFLCGSTPPAVMSPTNHYRWSQISFRVLFPFFFLFGPWLLLAARNAH